jgi:hypothetical protein
MAGNRQCVGVGVVWLHLDGGGWTEHSLPNLAAVDVQVLWRMKT